VKRTLCIWAALLALLCTMLTACQKNTAKETPKDPPPKEEPSAEQPTVPPPPQDNYDIPLYTNEKTPIIRIRTEDGKRVPSNKSEVICHVSLESSVSGQNAIGLPATIRVRGNGSLAVGHSTGKYPYKLKFDSPINLFDLGQGNAKDWVLLAHAGDQTMLRDYAAKTLGDLLSGIPYSPNTRLVTVYLNDEYIGIYELTEQVEVQKCRIDINDSLTGEENGFLVELDNYAEEGEDVFVTVGRSTFTIKSDIHSDEQIAFIQEYLEDVNTAIYKGDYRKLGSLVDMKSLLDMYLLQEYAKNIDAGWSSFYMYREAGGKLIFAPPWDFDLAFGNDMRLDNGAVEDLYIGTGRNDFMQNHHWYIALYENDWFRDLAAKRWAQISDTLIPRLIDAVRQTGASIAPDMENNYKRWNFLGKRQHQEPNQILKLKTYWDHVNYLVEWMEARKEILDAEFAL